MFYNNGLLLKIKKWDVLKMFKVYFAACNTYYFSIQIHFTVTKVSFNSYLIALKMVETLKELKQILVF